MARNPKDHRELKDSDYAVLGKKVAAAYGSALKPKPVFRRKGR